MSGRKSPLNKDLVPKQKDSFVVIPGIIVESINELFKNITLYLNNGT